MTTTHDQQSAKRQSAIRRKDSGSDLKWPDITLHYIMHCIALHYIALHPEPSFDTLKSAQKQKTLISKKSATNP